VRRWLHVVFRLTSTSRPCVRTIRPRCGCGDREPIAGRRPWSTRAAFVAVTLMPTPTLPASWRVSGVHPSIRRGTQTSAQSRFKQMQRTSWWTSSSARQASAQDVHVSAQTTHAWTQRASSSVTVACGWVSSTCVTWCIGSPLLGRPGAISGHIVGVRGRRLLVHLPAAPAPNHEAAARSKRSHASHCTSPVGEGR
jgi:hypothetical protein